MTYDTTILIPHFKTGRMSAYCVHQILKHKGNNDVCIVVVDNSGGEGIDYLYPFRNEIEILTYPSDQLLQSHGVAFDFAISQGLVDTKYFITLESDAFPVQDGFLDVYRNAYASGFDMIGSLLTLSGGTFIHPAGAMYTMELYKEAKDYINRMPFHYIPNVAMKESFPCHLMVHNDLYKAFIQAPEKYIEPDPKIKPYTRLQLKVEEIRYEPVAKSVFHQGMGYNQESYYTYGQRNPDTAITDFEATDDNLIYRIGCEPGEWLCFYAIAHGKRVGNILTTTKWLPNRVNQQQEFTLTENGIQHCWGVTAYHKSDAKEFQDIIDFKEKQTNDLYESMDKKFKI